jgi:hypothetical protein
MAKTRIPGFSSPIKPTAGATGFLGTPGIAQPAKAAGDKSAEAQSYNPVATASPLPSQKNLPSDISHAEGVADTLAKALYPTAGGNTGDPADDQ